MELLRFCVLAVVAVATLTLSWSRPGFAAEASSPAPLDAQVAELKASWDPGSGKSERDYYARAAQLGRNLYRQESSAANAAAVDLLNTLVAQRPPGGEVREADFAIGIGDLDALDSLARCLLAEGNRDLGDPEKKVQALAKLLGRIRAELVPDYAMKPTSRGLTLIDTPENRQANAAAVRDNSLNLHMNKRQYKLSALETKLAKRIVEYMAHVANSGGATREVVYQAVLDARLTPLENAAVVRALKR